MNEINFYKIADTIIKNNSIYSMGQDALRDKIISLLLEEPYFVQQIEEAESEDEGLDIGNELGEAAFKISTMILDGFGLNN